jgi:ABC-type Fe3+ transport system substrate-binding protein
MMFFRKPVSTFWDLALTLLVALLVSALQTTATEAAWRDVPAIEQLYEKAKAEHEVVIWAPVTTEFDWIQAEFSKRFPGIAIRGTGDLQAATKIIAEARAGRHSLDVWMNSLGGMIEVRKRGLLAKADWAAVGIDHGSVFFDGEAAATHNFVYALVYSKQFVQQAAAPRTWDELLKSKWRGKLVTQDFLLPRLMGFLALAWGPERTEKWGRALIDEQRILITNAPRESFLKTGERVMAVGDAVAQSFQYSDNGVAAGYAIMDVVPAVQFVVATLKEAPHPNAGRLLAAWLASEEGRLLAERMTHQADIRPGSKSPLVREIADAKAKVILEDLSTMDQRAEYYKKFSLLVRGQ